MNGKLYIVATPIGNLQDITFRALETLKTVDYILAEDTRKTIKLLSFYQIRTPLLSYRDQNHYQIFPRILAEIQSGKSFALVSDSGTPLISDPGYRLVSELVKAEIEIVPIPGANAAIAALSASGFPTDKFLFLGFLPKGKNKRQRILKDNLKLDATIIIYESPFRIIRLLSEIHEIFKHRKIVVANELTKKWEKFFRGNSEDVQKKITHPKGEFTILIKKYDQKDVTK